jgi:molybdenum cofactor biosynthesis enzyme MoaA
MCNIWQTPDDLPELTADEWLNVLGSSTLTDLKELDITGGEPFLRDDLAQILLGIGQLKAERLPHLQSIAITTNGFLTQKILDVVSAVIAPLEKTGI